MERGKNMLPFLTARDFDDGSQMHFEFKQTCSVCGNGLRTEDHIRTYEEWSKNRIKQIMQDAYVKGDFVYFRGKIGETTNFLVRAKNYYQQRDKKGMLSDTQN